MTDKEKNKELEETVSEEEIIELEPTEQTGIELEPVTEEIPPEEPPKQEIGNGDDVTPVFTSRSEGNGEGIYNFLLVFSFFAFLAVIVLVVVEATDFYDVPFIFFGKK